MGYASIGHTVFDPIMKALQELGASDEMRTDVASLLIGTLQDVDWDTEDESLEEFADDPAIVKAFADHEIYLPGSEAYRLKWG